MSCEFCKQFNFKNTGIDINKYGVSIFTTCAGDCEVPKEKQFNFCPKCGCKLSKEEGRYPVQMVNDNYDITHNPKVEEKYPILYKEVYDHDKVSVSSWYDLSSEAYEEWTKYIKDTTIGYYG